MFLRDRRMCAVSPWTISMAFEESRTRQNSKAPQSRWSL